MTEHISNMELAERVRARAELGLLRAKNSRLLSKMADMNKSLEAAQKREAMMREALVKCREFVARFLVPWKHHLPESWLSGFEESGCVVFDAIGFVKAKPIEDPEPTSYVSKEAVRPIVEALVALARCPTCEGKGTLVLECQACLCGEGKCTCATEEPTPCGHCDGTGDIAIQSSEHIAALLKARELGLLDK